MKLIDILESVLLFFYKEPKKEYIVTPKEAWDVGKLPVIKKNGKLYYEVYYAMANHYENIEKDMFDQMSQEQQQKILEKLGKMADDKYVAKQVRYDRDNGY